MYYLLYFVNTDDLEFKVSRLREDIEAEIGRCDWIALTNPSKKFHLSYLFITTPLSVHPDQLILPYISGYRATNYTTWCQLVHTEGFLYGWMYKSGSVDTLGRPREPYVYNKETQIYEIPGSEVCSELKSLKHDNDPKQICEKAQTIDEEPAKEVLASSKSQSDLELQSIKLRARINDFQAALVRYTTQETVWFDKDEPLEKFVAAPVMTFEVWDELVTILGDIEHYPDIDEEIKDLMCRALGELNACYKIQHAGFKFMDLKELCDVLEAVGTATELKHETICDIADKFPEIQRVYLLRVPEDILHDRHYAKEYYYHEGCQLLIGLDEATMRMETKLSVLEGDDFTRFKHQRVIYMGEQKDICSICDTKEYVKGQEYVDGVRPDSLDLQVDAPTVQQQLSGMYQCVVQHGKRVWRKVLEYVTGEKEFEVVHPNGTWTLFKDESPTSACSTFYSKDSTTQTEMDEFESVSEISEEDDDEPAAKILKISPEAKEVFESYAGALKQRKRSKSEDHVRIVKGTLDVEDEQGHDHDFRIIKGDVIVKTAAGSPDSD